MKPYEIVQILANMRPRTRMYEAVKAELKRQGRWKYKTRGRHVK